MIIRIICIGKLKETYWKDAISEYIKRIKPFSNIEIVELSEEKLITENDSNIEIVKSLEGKRILEKINEKDYCILLDIKGTLMDSVELSNKIKSLIDDSINKIDFIIGGSYGVSDLVKARADLKLSFSKLTFPHQMFRVILLEQIYRSFTIINNRKYHK